MVKVDKNGEILMNVCQITPVGHEFCFSSGNTDIVDDEGDTDDDIYDKILESEKFENKITEDLYKKICADDEKRKEILKLVEDYLYNETLPIVRFSSNGDVIGGISMMHDIKQETYEDIPEEITLCFWYCNPPINQFKKVVYKIHKVEK